MLRVFFGIPIDSTVAEQLWQDLGGLRRSVPEELNSVAVDKWHITVKFFANINAETLSSIARSAQNICNGTKTFAVQIKKIATFPSPQSQTLAAHVVANDNLRSLHTKLDDHGKKMGIKPEARRYRPHITLAKFRSKVHHIEPMLYSDLFLPITELVLFESKLSSEGSTYVPLRRFRLNQ